MDELMNILAQGIDKTTNRERKNIEKRLINPINLNFLGLTSGLIISVSNYLKYEIE